MWEWLRRRSLTLHSKRSIHNQRQYVAAFPTAYRLTAEKLGIVQNRKVAPPPHFPTSIPAAVNNSPAMDQIVFTERFGKTAGK